MVTAYLRRLICIQLVAEISAFCAARTRKHARKRASAQAHKQASRQAGAQTHKSRHARTRAGTQARTQAHTHAGTRARTHAGAQARASAGAHRRETAQPRTTRTPKGSNPPKRIAGISGRRRRRRCRESPTTPRRRRALAARVFSGSRAAGAEARPGVKARGHGQGYGQRSRGCVTWGGGGGELAVTDSPLARWLGLAPDPTCKRGEWATQTPQSWRSRALSPLTRWLSRPSTVTGCIGPASRRGPLRRRLTRCRPALGQSAAPRAL